MHTLSTLYNYNDSTKKKSKEWMVELANILMIVWITDSQQIWTDNVKHVSLLSFNFVCNILNLHNL